MTCLQLCLEQDQVLITTRSVRPVNDVAIKPDGGVIASSSRDGTVVLWDRESGATHAALRPDRRYVRMDITDLTGVSDVQKMALKTLGVSERNP